MVWLFWSDGLSLPVYTVFFFVRTIFESTYNCFLAFCRSNSFRDSGNKTRWKEFCSRPIFVNVFCSCSIIIFNPFFPLALHSQNSCCASSIWSTRLWLHFSILTKHFYSMFLKSTNHFCNVTRLVSDLPLALLFLFPCHCWKIDLNMVMGAVSCIFKFLTPSSARPHFPPLDSARC